MKALKISLGLLIAILVIALIAYKTYHKPHVNVANTKADISLTAAAILAHFSSDETQSNKKYLEKIIAVKGLVSKVEVADGKGIISLQTNDNFGSVLCYLTASESKNIHQLKVGQEVTLKGICTGFLMDVVLIKCSIIK